LGTNSVSYAAPTYRDSERPRKSRNAAEAYKWYAAQVIPQIDADLPAEASAQAGIAKIAHFRMETNYTLFQEFCKQSPHLRQFLYVPVRALRTVPLIYIMKLLSIV